MRAEVNSQRHGINVLEHNTLTELCRQPVINASGNVLDDGSNQYGYDGEGRLCTVYNKTLATYTGHVYGKGLTGKGLTDGMFTE